MTREELQSKIELFREERDTQPKQYHKEYNKCINKMKLQVLRMKAAEENLQALEEKAQEIYKSCLV